MRTLLATALAVALVGCSHQPPHQAASESCTDKRQFACLHRTTPSLRVRYRAAHSITKKAKSASTTAKTGPTATHIPTPPPSLRTQLEPKTSADSKSRTIQEQVAAATEVAERMTAAGKRPNTSDLVAVVMVHPEIKSVPDLAGKRVAIDERYSASQVDVSKAFAVAGASLVKVSAGQTAAVDRLSNDEVTAAVLALVSADAAEAFPEIAGFKIFRVPLCPACLRARP